MADSKSTSGGESLSLQTLVIAAAASAVAAVLVSKVWKDGTVIAAAMTPVIVAIVKEALAKPMDSDIVKKPVQQVSRLASSRRTAAGGAATRAEAARAGAGRAGDPPFTPAPPPPTDPRGVTSDGNGGPTQGDVLHSHPRHTYGSGRRRPIHLKVALVTGLLAFVIAAAALTLPELLFGGAIGSGHDTTFFGGGGSSSTSDKQKNNGSTQPNQSKPTQRQTTPASPAPTKPPSSGKPPPTSAQTTPQQTTPQQTTPVPTAPTPPKP